MRKSIRGGAAAPKPEQAFELPPAPVAAPSAAPAGSPAPSRGGRGKGKWFILLALIILLLLIVFCFTRCTSDEESALAAASSAAPASEADLTAASAGDIQSVSDNTTQTQTQPSASDTAASVAEEAEHVLKTIRYAGYEARLDSYDTYTVISYPAVLSASHIISFIDSEEEKYGIPSSALGVLVTGENEITVSYEAIEDEGEREAVLSLIEEDLAQYLASFMEEEEEDAAAAPVVVSESISDDGIVTKTISYAGYEAYLVSTPEEIVIQYPQIISAGDVSSFLESERDRYGLSETAFTYLITDADEITVTHDEIDDVQTRKEILDVIEKDLSSYLSSAASEEETNAAVMESEAAGGDEEDAQESPDVTVINNEITINEASVPAEEDGKWKEIKHTLSLSLSPYALSYVDYFNARDVISNAGIAHEFLSKYGFAVNLSYEWRAMKHLSIGAEAGWNGYFLQRSTHPGAFYYQIPLLANVMFHTGGDLDFFAGVNFGADLAGLLGVSGSYFIGGIETGLAWRFAQHWSLMWKLSGEITYQPHETAQLSSLTFTAQPLFLGVSYHF